MIKTDSCRLHILKFNIFITALVVDIRYRPMYTTLFERRVINHKVIEAKNIIAILRNQNQTRQAILDH